MSAGEWTKGMISRGRRCDARGGAPGLWISSSWSYSLDENLPPSDLGPRPRRDTMRNAGSPCYQESRRDALHGQASSVGACGMGSSARQDEVRRMRIAHLDTLQVTLMRRKGTYNLANASGVCYLCAESGPRAPCLHATLTRTHHHAVAPFGCFFFRIHQSQSPLDGT